jgi:hypothetical protein
VVVAFSAASLTAAVPLAAAAAMGAVAFSAAALTVSVAFLAAALAGAVAFWAVVPAEMLIEFLRYERGVGSGDGTPVTCWHEGCMPVAAMASGGHPIAAPWPAGGTPHMHMVAAAPEKRVHETPLINTNKHHRR